jgi:pimeloyl-ACP methyl ester carboxylesterase
MKTVQSLLVALMLSTPSPVPAAENKLIALDVRPGASVPIYYMKRDAAWATVVLLPGGAGGIGIRDGVPTSDNFVVRSRDHFAESGFNVAVVGRPTDKKDLDFADRIGAWHIEDLRKVVAHLKRDAGVPVWLVGTSRGTISAAAAAIALGKEELAGIVLTASVTSAKRPGALPKQQLSAIRIPVLVLHHEKDACPICQPSDVPLIISGLKNAPVKKQIMVKAGANPKGNPCEALHWHGFIGMEKEAVQIIAAWIKNPRP